MYTLCLPHQSSIITCSSGKRLGGFVGGSSTTEKKSLPTRKRKKFNKNLKTEQKLMSLVCLF